jgi:hypothetical protein
MGDVNQLIYLKKRLPVVEGSVLEIGSKNYGNTATFRDFYASNVYVGVDLEAGPNVDVVADLTRQGHGLQNNAFALVICCSVLEHVKKPWLFAPVVSDLVKLGGHLYISVPWVWPYHAFPDDYYRYSFRGIQELFDGFEWSQITYATGVPGEFTPIDLAAPYQDLAMVVRKSLQKDKKNRGVFAGAVRWFKRNIGKTDMHEPLREYLPYLMVNMIGTKRVSE